jgi:iron complex outermembrane receptor protein
MSESPIRGWLLQSVSLVAVIFSGAGAAHAQQQSLLPEISVTDNASPKGQEEGTAAQGYRVETAKTTGPWGDKPILDTPYSVHVTSADLMQNMIAGTTDQLIKFNPVVQPQYNGPFAGYSTTSTIRGFSQSSALNGIPIRGTWYGNDMEDMERMEVFSGLSGFLYGANNVGGMINYVTKRPTATPLANVTVGNYGGSQYFSHLDVGGPIDKEGRFGYRFNAVHQDGDNPIGVGIRRTLLSGAVDWNVADSLKIQINAAHTDYDRIGTSGVGLSLPAGTTSIPSAKDFDNTRPLTPNWGFNHAVADRVGGDLRWDINNDTTLRAAALYRNEFRTAYSPYALTPGANGAYSFRAIAINGPIAKETGGYLYLDRKFETFGIQHKVTLGTNFSRNDYFIPSNDQYGRDQYAVDTATVSFPTLAAAQNSAPLAMPTVGTTPKYHSSDFTNSNVVLGDDITLNRYFSLLVGANHSTIETDSYAKTGVITASYGKSAVTPTASLIFKPTSNISLYSSYIESLESGGVVARGTIPPYTNAGAILQPTISKQVEVGAKAKVGGVFLTLAAFQIDKANLYDVDNFDGTRTRNQDGRQVHKGIEFTATGKVTDDLTIMGGGTYLDTEITKTNNAAILGKAPPRVPNWRLALWGEYRLPFLQKLYLTGGVSYLGSSYYDAVNTLVIPSYTVGDVGLRYETLVNGTPVIMRMNVQNVADIRYWQNSGDLVPGLPRTYTFSATAKF